MAGLLAALLSLSGAGCGPQAPPNVVIILFDTLRRDHVGTYGYDRDTTPTLDAIARDGLVFEHAIAQSSWTRPSVASFFTSRYPSDLHPNLYAELQGANVDEPLPDEALTLAEIFAENGYRTVAAATNDRWCSRCG